MRLRLIGIMLVLVALVGTSAPQTATLASPLAQNSRELTVLAGVGQDTVGGVAFFPETVRIRAGDTVTWRINSDATHTVSFTMGTVPDGPTQANRFLPPGEVVPFANVSVPEGPTGAQMDNPLIIWPTSSDGSVETYSGTGYVNSGQLTREPRLPGVLGREAFSLTFDRPGSYTYVCLVHAIGMAGRVDVVPASTLDVPDQAAIDAQAQTEMAAILALSERTRTADSTPRSLPGVGDTSMWFVRAGNSNGVNDLRVQLQEFLPKDLTVQAGDTVFWQTNAAHTVSFMPLPPPPEANVLEMGPDGIWRQVDNPLVNQPARPSAAFNPIQYFNSGNINATPIDGRNIWALAFETPGTFEYFCAVHRERGMTGTITVLSR